MRYGVENLTVRTDDRRYAGRGRTQDWNAFLQRAQAGLRQMLWGSPASEPGVIGRIEKEIGAMRLVYDLPGEDDFIADLGRHAERRPPGRQAASGRSEEHTSELQSLMRISYAVFCLKKKRKIKAQK